MAHNTLFNRTFEVKDNGKSCSFVAYIFVVFKIHKLVKYAVNLMALNYN